MHTTVTLTLSRCVPLTLFLATKIVTVVWCYVWNMEFELYALNQDKWKRDFLVLIVFFHVSSI